MDRAKINSPCEEKVVAGLTGSERAGRERLLKARECGSTCAHVRGSKPVQKYSRRPEEDKCILRQRRGNAEGGWWRRIHVPGSGVIRHQGQV